MLAWPGYAEDGTNDKTVDWVHPFTQSTGCKVNVKIGATSDEMVKLMKTGQIDSTQGMIRLNHLHPPFDNVKARQAMYYLINQEDFLRAIVGDPKYYRVCPGLLTCGGPYENDGGTQWMKEYTTLSKHVAKDVSELVRIISGAGRY